MPLRRLVFDLTVETEHCAIYLNVLSEGNNHTSRMFAFKTYECVRSSLHLSLEDANEL